MLKALKFVQGAVAKKEFIPALTHFFIAEGKVRGFNGSLALCSPIPFDISCKPRADMLIKAISNCSETVQMSMTPTGRLSVKSGKFRALVECVKEEVAHIVPTGDHVAIDGSAVLQAMNTLWTFVGNDATRPWSNGVLLQGSSAFATNNIVLVEYWLGSPFPLKINIPRDAIRELIRLKEPPIGAQVDETSITFHYQDGRWLRTQLLDSAWPDVNRILDMPGNPVPVHPALFEAIASVKPFVDKTGRILFGDGSIRTHATGDQGAHFNLEGFNYEGVYQADMVSLLEGVATKIDWTTYPKPCIFHGKRLRGAIIGMYL